MKKIICSLFAAGSALSAIAQAPSQSWSQDKDLSRVVLDLNFLGGGFSQHMEMAKTQPNYLNGINVGQGTTDFHNGLAAGGDIQLGLFVGKNKHWGIGTGLMYMREWGDVKLNNLHADYQATDNNGYVFRQIVTANTIDERIKTDNFNIPVLLKYKNRMSKHWGFTADAGVLFNLQMRNEYKTKASFDYEAAYKFVNNDDGTRSPVYDNGAVPDNNDFLITKSQFTKNNPSGNVNDYFNTKASQGYNVGLGVTPAKQTGKVDYTEGSVGFLVQPSVNYFFSDHVALNAGAYFLFQPFNNPHSGGYTLTNKPGDYSSVLNSTTEVKTYSYGGNLGLRFFFGRKATPKLGYTVDQTAPSICGLCDGSITLRGLDAGQPASVTYVMNGTAATNTASGTVAPDGTLNIPGLCAGTYTGIEATEGRRKGGNASVINIVDPPFRISSAKSVNPTGKGVCDGTITLNGLNAGQPAKVSYSMNGVAQASFATTVDADRSVTISALCEGTYTSISVVSGNCTANLTNPTSIMLTVPAPPPPPPAPVPEVKEGYLPVLFDFNKSSIHESSYPTIDEAYKDMKENKDATLSVEGNTDAVGSQDYNQKLSERRASSVKTYLTKKGISAKRIKTKGNGKNSPVAPNDTAEGRAKNRRAVMNLNK